MEFLFGFILLVENSYSQSDLNKEFHNRYYTYCENFRKYLIDICKDQGQSLPNINIRLAVGDKVKKINPAILITKFTIIENIPSSLFPNIFASNFLLYNNKNPYVHLKKTQVRSENDIHNN